MQLLNRITIFYNWVPTLRWGTTKYKTRNQVQIFCMLNCTEDFKVTLHTHLAHPFVIARIQFYLRKQLSRPPNISKNIPREYPHLVLKSRKIPMKTHENPT